ncbi:right-handed parallel beta-helix repeat-containing protein [Pseudomonas sp. Sample_10]|uniref:right-handed parallel beta-helix repeat-containing protein n=1 Tax=Pseudomonas sp. Sample_10 TaxID=2448269 RepID=UPI0010366AB5|nr:right-handed parallel beta-helix repeat-containing protein [Pseudomonas sp. Sample_10]
MRFCLSVVCLLLLSGVVQAGGALIIDSPKNYTSSVNAIVIPKEGLTISAPVRVSGKLKITGQGRLHIKGFGRFIVEKNATLDMRGVSVLVSELEVQNDIDGGNIIRLNGGALTLKNNRVKIDVAFDPSFTVSEIPWGQRPRFWFVGLSDIAKKKRRSVLFNIVDNEFESSQLYAAGAIKLSTRKKDELLRVSELDNVFVRGGILRNRFVGFHGGIFINGGNKVLISDNVLMKNSYLAIIAGGKNIQITNNRILYPGNGTTGDGITVYDVMIDGRISGNLIYAGSCYGIWVLANHVNGLDIQRNTILNGITSGIYMSAKDVGGYIGNVLVKYNVITGNAGFAVAVENGQDVAISNNHFEGNAAGFSAQLYVSKLAKNITVKGNTAAKKITPEWAKDMALYRHQTYEDNEVFTPAINAQSAPSP